MLGKGRTRIHCAHINTVSVRSAFVMRRVCEECGNVSIEFLEGLSGKAERGNFERPVDRSDHHGG